MTEPGLVVGRYVVRPVAGPLPYEVRHLPSDRRAALMLRAADAYAHAQVLDRAGVVPPAADEGAAVSAPPEAAGGRRPKPPPKQHVCRTCARPVYKARPGPGRYPARCPSCKGSK